MLKDINSEDEKHLGCAGVVLKTRKIKIIIIMLLIAVILTGYSLFFRAYLDPQLYLDLAWAEVPYDPYIRNWDQPDFQLIWEKGRPVVHFTFYSDRKTVDKPTQVYIDALTKTVKTEGIPAE